MNQSGHTRESVRYFLRETNAAGTAVSTLLWSGTLEQLRERLARYPASVSLLGSTPQILRRITSPEGSVLEEIIQ